MVMEHYCLVCQLFNKGWDFQLSETIIPLCNNTAKDSILAMMPECDSKTVVATWKVPTKKDVEKWLDELVEKAIRVEDDMIHSTKEAEEAFIAARVKEA